MTQLQLPIIKLLELGFVGRNISAKDKIKAEEIDSEPLDENMYLDDKAVRFTSWSQALSDVSSLN